MSDDEIRRAKTGNRIGGAIVAVAVVALIVVLAFAMLVNMINRAVSEPAPAQPATTTERPPPENVGYAHYRALIDGSLTRETFEPVLGAACLAYYAQERDWERVIAVDAGAVADTGVSEEILREEFSAIVDLAREFQLC